MRFIHPNVKNSKSCNISMFRWKVSNVVVEMNLFKVIRMRETNRNCTIRRLSYKANILKTPRWLQSS